MCFNTFSSFQICIFIRYRSEFFLIKKQIYIFLRCRYEFFFKINRSTSSLDANLNFSQIKNWFVSFLDTDLIFKHMQILKQRKRLCMIVFMVVCFILIHDYINLDYEWSFLLRKYFLKYTTKQIWIFVIKKSFFFI